MEKWHANLALVFQSTVSLDDVDDVASDAPGPELLAEQRERISKALERLTDVERSVVMAVAAGENVAAKLKLSPNQVQSILVSVRAKVQDLT
jgi:DNA-directed RNA polymerase specialized sigma24 family protein